MTAPPSQGSTAAVPTHYLRPLCAGLASTPKAAARRVAALLNALDGVNRFVADGDLERACRAFHAEIRRGLEAEGWRLRAGDTWGVLPPKRHT